MCRANPIPNRRPRRIPAPSPGGFTLVELMVVIGIIAVIVAILLPVVTAARTRAKVIECQSNARQLCAAFFAYATAYRAFPPDLLPSTTTPRPQIWYEAERVGQFFKVGSSDIRGRAAACPEDPDAVRSYAMNTWACSKVERWVLDPGPGILLSNGTGRLWKPWSRPASRLMLLAERWSSSGPARAGWTADAIIGQPKATPGQRFGGGTGVVPLLSGGRWGLVNCELPYVRHRPAKSHGRGLQPIGRITIAYADGHVALKSESDLYDPATGLSTLDTLWSPMDAELNR